MMVNKAARKTPSRVFPNQAKRPMTMATSWNMVSTAASAMVHRNRIAR